VKVAKKFIIFGRVQGVGFRYFAARVANRLGLVGYVKNNWDGTVEAYAIGEPTALDEFQHLLAQGPASARVTKLFATDEPLAKHTKDFMIE
jgi:acylphosphatase